MLIKKKAGKFTSAWTLKKRQKKFKRTIRKGQSENILREIKVDLNLSKLTDTNTHMVLAVRFL